MKVSMISIFFACIFFLSACSTMPIAEDELEHGHEEVYLIVSDKTELYLSVNNSQNRDGVEINKAQTSLLSPTEKHLSFDIQFHPNQVEGSISFRLILKDKKTFKPGKYHLKIVLNSSQGEQEYNREFIIRNTIYTPWDYLFPDA